MAFVTKLIGTNGSSDCDHIIKPLSFKLNNLEAWGKRQSPLEIYPITPLGYTTVPPKTLVAKFGTNPLSFKLNTLETWGKRQPPLEICPGAPLDTLQCHQRLWWPNL